MAGYRQEAAGSPQIDIENARGIDRLRPAEIVPGPAAAANKYTAPMTDGRTTTAQGGIGSNSMRRMGGDVSAVIAFLTEHFQEGSISPGDKDEQGMWQPIVSVAAFLHEFAKGKTGKDDYLDITVRKTETA
jgi:hypothetical protein